MIRFAEYIEAADDEAITDEEAAERMALIAQQWSEEEEEILHSYLDKYIHTLDKDTRKRRGRRFIMVGETLLKKIEELERRMRPKLRLIK